MFYLEEAVRLGASDLHLAAGIPLTFRVDGNLLSSGEPLQCETIQNALAGIMTKEQARQCDLRGEVDFTYEDETGNRFRVNVYRQQGEMSIAARVIPAKVPSLAELELPPGILKFTESHHGMVVATGPTGSGKSTTLAALVHHINQTQKYHIITLEDPTEYRHTSIQSIVHQREIGRDTESFATGLRACLRQDPDVILIGEMRDLDTARTALEAAETGHLVLTTMHTGNSVEAIQRLIHMYPSGQQAEARYRLASVLVGIIAQQLYRRQDRRGRVAALEVLVNTAAVANLIRLDRLHQIRSALQTGRPHGMQTMEMHLKELMEAGIVPI